MHGNSGNQNSHVRTGPVHDPTGTGESDSRSGGFSYENHTRFHARLGCDPIEVGVRVCFWTSVGLQGVIPAAKTR